MSDEKNNLLSQVRQQMRRKQGQSYWRSLEELADTQEFQQLVKNEFPDSPLLWDASVNRRGFLKFMGASLALAGLGACTRQPTERIIPYVTPPEVMSDVSASNSVSCAGASPSVPPIFSSAAAANMHSVMTKIHRSFSRHQYTFRFH